MNHNYAQKVLLVIALCWVAFPTGCNKSTVQPPLAPGYTNPTDQSFGTTLAAAHAFYETLQQDAASGKWTPKPAEKKALNDLAAALNVAQPLYLAYHAGQAGVTAGQVQQAVADVVNKQAALQSQIGAK